MTSKDDPRYEQAVDVLTRAFCGTDKVAPEPVLGWAYAGTEDGLLGPLRAKPTETRRAFFRWLAELDMHIQVSTDGIYALVDEHGTMVAVNSSSLSKAPPASVLLSGLCQLGLMPGSDSEKRGVRWRFLVIYMALDEAHAKTIPGHHLYVRTVSVHPDHQGRGVGGALLELVADLADAYGLPAYLECVGDRNEGFYAKKGGFNVALRTPIEAGGLKLGLNGGIAGMVRPMKIAAS